MAHRTVLFGESSTRTRASLSYGHRKADWGFPLVRRSDSRRLPPASTALAGSWTTGRDRLVRCVEQAIRNFLACYRTHGNSTIYPGFKLSIRRALACFGRVLGRVLGSTSLYLLRALLVLLRLRRGEGFPHSGLMFPPLKNNGLLCGMGLGSSLSGSARTFVRHSAQGYRQLA